MTPSDISSVCTPRSLRSLSIARMALGRRLMPSYQAIPVLDLRRDELGDPVVGRADLRQGRRDFEQIGVGTRGADHLAGVDLVLAQRVRTFALISPKIGRLPMN